MSVLSAPACPAAVLSSIYSSHPYSLPPNQVVAEDLKATTAAATLAAGNSPELAAARTYGCLLRDTKKSCFLQSMPRGIIAGSISWSRWMGIRMRNIGRRIVFIRLRGLLLITMLRRFRSSVKVTTTGGIEVEDAGMEFYGVIHSSSTLY
jgi:hypothetical protein